MSTVLIQVSMDGGGTARIYKKRGEATCTLSVGDARGHDVHIHGLDQKALLELVNSILVRLDDDALGGLLQAINASRKKSSSTRAESNGAESG